MSAFRLAVGAKQDLQNIFAYVAEQSGEQRAHALVREIISTFPHLSEFPRMGMGRSDLSRGLRSFPVAKYLVFYRRYLDGVRIIRVIHGARAINRIFRRKRR